MSSDTPAKVLSCSSESRKQSSLFHVTSCSGSRMDVEWYERDENVGELGIKGARRRRVGFRLGGRRLLCLLYQFARRVDERRKAVVFLGQLRRQEFDRGLIRRQPTHPTTRSEV